MVNVRTSMTAATIKIAASATSSRSVNPPLNMKPPLDGGAFQFVTNGEMTDFDVIIVGGGIAGASLGAEMAGNGGS